MNANYYKPESLLIYGGKVPDSKYHEYLKEPCGKMHIHGSRILSDKQYNELRNRFSYMFKQMVFELYSKLIVQNEMRVAEIKSKVNNDLGSVVYYNEDVLNTAIKAVEQYANYFSLIDLYKIDKPGATE